jgi:hypothetical protein
MRTHALVGMLSLAIVLGVCSGSLLAQGKPPTLAERLAAPVDWTGLEADPKVTLQEALDDIAAKLQVTFDISEMAFHDEGLMDVLEAKVAERPLRPLRGVPLQRVLDRVVSRIPVPGGAVYQVRGETIEITTRTAQRREVWGEQYQGPFLPLVHAVFDRRSLAQALKVLAERSGRSIVIDARVGEKAETPVSASLLNTPVDTATRLLADMAGLKVFLVDNILYVTTPATAARLEAEERQRFQSVEPVLEPPARRQGTLPAIPALPAGGLQ